MLLGSGTMSRIIARLLLGSAWLDVVLCDLSDAREPMEPRNVPASLPRFYPSSQSYGAPPENTLRRSYYGGSSASPAQYHTFDPISVLASLAFLAFLLQSFASLYDRSRSMLPTIVSGRRQSTDATIPEVSRRALLRDYAGLGDDFDMSE